MLLFVHIRSMTILAAVDGDETVDDVVAVGRDLSEAYGDELVVLHVLAQDAFGDRQRDRADEGGEYFVDDGKVDAEKVASNVVENTVDRPAGSPSAVASATSRARSSTRPTVSARATSSSAGASARRSGRPCSGARPSPSC